MTLNTNDDFRSQFNSDWANKLVIAVDEVLLDKREDSERLKNLSTAHQFKAEAKGKDRQEIEFFGKFILCSNNETGFIYIDKEEIRYWVIKINEFEGVLKSNLNGLFGRLKNEIPAFLGFLTKRSFHTTKQSRMWFTPRQIETKALLSLKKNNQSRLEKEIIDILLTIIEEKELEEIKFQIKDILISMNNRNARNHASVYDIKTIVNTSWKLESINSSYIQYIICYDETIMSKPHKGRFYTITKGALLNINS